MEQIRTRKRNRAVEYYLFAKVDGSILYNDWFPIDNDFANEMSLCGLPECSVTAWTIRNRINYPEKYKFNTLWELITSPPIRSLGRPPKKPVKLGRKTNPVVLKAEEIQFINNMALFKAGSLAHTVR